jgi:hypothetical protein
VGKGENHVIAQAHMQNLFAASPFHQFPHFYRHGEADTCQRQIDECVACFMIKSKAPSEIKVRPPCMECGLSS